MKNHTTAAKVKEEIDKLLRVGFIYPSSKGCIKICQKESIKFIKIDDGLWTKSQLELAKECVTHFSHIFENNLVVTYAFKKARDTFLSLIQPDTIFVDWTQHSQWRSFWRLGRVSGNAKRLVGMVLP